ncbi:MAG: SH3 domain-containing protein [Lachnospiraceae bacterium]|nr:SH3 domain-containing protein [Lachnospiraceae bacterium]
MNSSEEQFTKLKENVKTLMEKVKKRAGQLLELMAANKKISIPSAAAVLIIILAIFAAGGNGKNVAMPAEGETQAQTEGIGSVIPVPDVPLEENAYPEINDLMHCYFAALADGDLETILSLKSYTSEEEQIRIQKKSEYIESYPQVDCYTKIGPMEDSYLVYVYYEALFYGYSVQVPGISSYFICRNEEGNYWIFDGAVDENVENYIAEISAQEDVRDLFNRADVKYVEAKESDETLSALLEELPQKLKTAVAEELAAKVTETEASEPETEIETEEVQETPVTQIVAANDVVNIRSSDSETADKLGKAEVGQQFTLLENRGNGWSKIDFNGREAFIKTEFLTVVGAQTADENDAENAGQEDEAGQAGQNAGEPSDPSGKTVRVKESVNIRKSASENGERIATVYQGEVLQVIMKQADGWTKIKYNGQTAYVKSEYVE